MTPVPATSFRVIAHRGASGYLPEHTLPAYAMAYGQGADYVEPDLVRTRDGEFVCLHDIHLELTTNVEQVFPERAREDGRYYAADFTLAEVRQLSVHERTKDRFPQEVDLRLRVPTFREMVQLVEGLNRTTGRLVGVYPELKQPAWHREQGLAMEEDFLELATELGFVGPNAPIFVQCFEDEPLRRLRELGSRLPQVFLLGEGGREWLDPARMAEIATFANGIGPAKPLIEGRPELIEAAHTAGLEVHPFTFRVDQLPSSYASHEAELEHFVVELRVDGLFTDFPDHALAWRSGLD